MLGRSGTDRGAKEAEREELEIDLLLEAVWRHYGFDFRGYSRASLKRRLWRRVHLEQLSSISALTERLLHAPQSMEHLLLDLSINVTSMFRDPSFFLAFRQKVVPLLRTYPFVRVWNAGCSTGEETWSLAILLHEEGLLDRCRIYATDINESVLAQAKSGRFPLEKMQEYTESYQAAGGKAAFSEYYVAAYDAAQFDRTLCEHVVFAQHNLVSDRSFNEFHVVVCRNVLIYFDTDLQHHVHDLFYDSLVRLGVLGLGRKEAISFTSHEDDYEPLDADERIYRRVR